MKKLSSSVIIMLIIELILMPSISYTAFYDINYPPNSSGYTDYTDTEADEEKEKVEIPTSEEYIGKSSNNYLKSLVVENATMEPEFNRQYVDYNLKLKNETNRKINIMAVAEDEKATIQGAGEVEIQDGINNIRILVTAENGNVQIYSLILETPFKQSNLVLESLEIYGVNIKTGKNEKEKLTPSFEKKIYEYSVELPYEVTSLDINAKSVQNTFISIIGENDLEIGENKILIEITDKEDESRKTTYVINAKRKEEKDYAEWIMIGSVIILIFVITIMFKKTKENTKKNKIRKK